MRHASHVRRPYFESLEDRRLLAADWFQQDQVIAFDPPAPDPELNAEFGYAVAVDGDTMVVGTPFEDRTSLVDAGAAYVYTRDENGTPFDNTDDFWQGVAKLTAADASAGEQFGYSVSISGDTIVVGRALDVFNSNPGADAGAAYVFTLSGGVWSQQAKLTASDGASDDEFGAAVSISGDTVVVGSPQDDAVGFNSGSAYVFTRTGGVWSEEAKIAPLGTGTSDLFGISVSVDGDSFVAGSVSDDDGGSSSGAAYVFGRTGGVWSEESKLTASDPAASDNFGWSVSIDDNSVVVGSRLADPDVGGGPVSNAGAAYVYSGTGGVWSQEAKLTASDLAAGDQFGRSVAVSGDTVVVGSPFFDVSGLLTSGAAYIFARSGGVWSEETNITSDVPTSDDSYGWAVAVSGDTVVVGSRSDDEGFPDAGSAYIYAREILNNEPTATDNSYATGEDTVIVGNVISRP